MISLVSFWWLWFPVYLPFWWISLGGLWKLPDGWDRLDRKWGLILMGEGIRMLNKSLIQFSVNGWGCVPSLFLAWGQTMVGVMKVMMISFKTACVCIVVFSAFDLAAGHCQPTPRQRLLHTHRQGWLSLLWGHWSFFLAPSAHRILFVPSKSLFPQYCGSSVIKSHWPPKSNPLGILSPFAECPSWEICCGS